MSEKPLVSILVNAYNEGRYIAQALDSALGQTYRLIEILVLDDYSTDQTPEIVKDYMAKDSRVKYIKPRERLGLVEGRNELLRQMKGEYFTYLDADDMYLPGKVEEEVAFLSAHLDVAVVYCDIGYFFDTQVSAEGVPQKIYRHSHVFYSDEGPGPTQQVFLRLLEKMFITNTATMFRRTVYDKLGGYRTDLGIVEDWEYFLRLTYGGYRIAFLDHDLVRYRLRWDSHTHFGRQVEVKESAVKIFEDLKQRMSDVDRERYRIDYWIAMRKETYAIALLATGQGKTVRKTVREISPHIGALKTYAIIFLSFLPASLVGFLMEKAWNMKKRNLFVPVGAT